MLCWPAEQKKCGGRGEELQEEEAFRQGGLGGAGGVRVRLAQCAPAQIPMRLGGSEGWRRVGDDVGALSSEWRDRGQWRERVLGLGRI